MEATAADAYADIVGSTYLDFHIERRWLRTFPSSIGDTRWGGTIDRLCYDGNGSVWPVEIKCPFYERPAERLPRVSYIAQVVMQLVAWKLPFGHIWIYQPGGVSQLFTVRMNPALWNGSFFPRLRVFQMWVDDDVEPIRMASSDKRRLVAQLNSLVVTV